MISIRDNKPLGLGAWLSIVGLDRRTVQLEPEESFFGQGDPADCVYCLQTGRAKISVVSERGKQATVTILSPGDFFGEEALATAPGVRVATATALNACTGFKIKRGEMVRALHQKHEFCDEFMSYLLARSMRTQADLVDQIFNSSEKRLARTLLLMAEFGKADEPKTIIPPITQETLAEMIGTTRSRVSFFMNRFRDLGLISYNGRIHVHKSRMKAALTDQWPLYNSETLQQVA
ncbi:MAG: Crp/Fnr family transcriptional regulator [Terracidiphilus sp.]|jgi:CRP-like cAMP-binding protein